MSYIQRLVRRVMVGVIEIHEGLWIKTLRVWDTNETRF